jgi:hypothetical protein
MTFNRVYSKQSQFRGSVYYIGKTETASLIRIHCRNELLWQIYTQIGSKFPGEIYWTCRLDQLKGEYMTFSQLHTKCTDHLRASILDLYKCHLSLRHYCGGQLFWQINNQANSQVSGKIFVKFGGY